MNAETVLQNKIRVALSDIAVTLKDIAAPVINRDKKVVSQMEIDHIKMMNKNPFRLGS